MRSLGGMDTMFAMAESATVHMHVTGVMRLRPRPGEEDPFERIRDVFAARLAAIPPLRWRLIEPPGGMGELRWVEDPDFDLDRHLTRRIPDGPVDRRRIEDLVSISASTPLERDRPLWRMEVVEGCDDGTIAVISAFHHAFMDGGAGLAPRTPFNGSLGPQRRVALTDAPFEHVRATKDLCGASVNYVVLAAVATAPRGAVGGDVADDFGPMTAAVPVSVRGADDDAATGNRTSAMMVQLPTDEADPLRRLALIVERSRRAKTSHRSMGGDLIERWAGVVPPWVVAAGAAAMERFGVADRIPPVFNAIVSNVAGPPIPIYLGGAEVIGIHPLGPLLDGGGLNITVMSNRDLLHVGVISDPELVPDPGGIARAVADGFEELHELAVAHGGSPEVLAS